MRAFLFRKVILDGINYYQFYKDDLNFNMDSSFADYKNRFNSDYFYIEAGSDVTIPDISMLNIYYDDGDNLKVVDDFELFERVFNALRDKYNFVVREIMPIDEIISKVRKKILFQDECVFNLINQIYLNQIVISSNLPIELKMNQKNNILFHGRKGSGKKSIIDCIKNELHLPYVDITISDDIKDTLEKIIKTLFERAETEEEASYGVVFIRDNYSELMDKLDENPLNIINYLTSQKIIEYHGKTIDFRTITFVVLLDDYMSVFNDLESIQNITNCMASISTRNLSTREKLLVLFSQSGRLYHYEKFLNQYGKKLIVDNKSLIKIINKCQEIDSSMNALNSIIDVIIKTSIANSKVDNDFSNCLSDVYINEECVKMIMSIFDSFQEKNYEDNDSSTINYDLYAKMENNKNKYIFEKIVADVTNRATKYIIGQDNQVRSFVYQLVENLFIAHKENLYNPKMYMQNILMRGNSGSGKTFIIKTVTDILNVPCFIADATDYTEEGYVGLSPRDMFAQLYHVAGDDLEKAQRGILVIDEIDKKATGAFDHGGPSRGAVLDSLLKPTEGTKLIINVGNKLNEELIEFDTSRVTVICAGAFQNIEKIRDERIGKRKIGYGNQDNIDVDTSITNDDFIEYGMSEQFMGRVNGIIELNANSKELFIDIMKKSLLSALKIKQTILGDRGIEIEYTESFYEELAKLALNMKQGVRGIGNALEKVLKSINIQDIRASQISKIILDGEVIKHPEEVILVEREKRKVKKIR